MAEQRCCPHCGVALTPTIGPPDTGWGDLLVCENNECVVFSGSKTDIRYKPSDSPLGCRYAEDVDGGYKSFNMLAFRGM